MRKIKRNIEKYSLKILGAIKNNSGQGAIETAITVLLAVILGALILGGLYALIDDTVLFSTSNKHDRYCYA